MEFDKIICGDSHDMRDVEDSSVALVRCGPPYNADIFYDAYDDNMPVDDYLTMLLNVWRECWRVLVLGGHIAVNVAPGGASSFTPEMRAILSRVEKLYALGDYDQAGRKFNVMVQRRVRRAVPVWWSHLVATGYKIGRGYDLADMVQDGGDKALLDDIVAASEADGAYADTAWAMEDDL